MRLGFGEILVVLVLAMLFFGPSKLPQLGSRLGQAIKGFKKGLNSLHDEIDVSPSAQEERKSLLSDVAGRAGPPVASGAALAGGRDPKRAS